MVRTRVKICGITRPEDAVAAAAAGADAIGMNFVGGPRKIDLSTAAAILQVLPPMITVAALIEAHPDSEHPGWDTIYADVGLTLFQLYGDLGGMEVSPARRAAIQFWPVVRVAGREDVMKLAPSVRPWRFIASAIVLDTFHGEKRGGTGTPFDWNWIAEARTAGALNGLPPLILAGGLNPDNVAEAIRIAQPWAVDVSSGVEFPGRPGRKDPARVGAFIKAVWQI